MLPDAREELSDAELEITLKDLLTMTAGYDWNEASPSYFSAENVRRQEVLSQDPVAGTLGMGGASGGAIVNRAGEVEDQPG